MDATSRALLAIVLTGVFGCSGKSRVLGGSGAEPAGSGGTSGAGGGAGSPAEMPLSDDQDIPGSQPRLDLGRDGHAVLAFAHEQALRVLLYRERATGFARAGPWTELVPRVAELSPSQGGFAEAALSVHAAAAGDDGASWVLYSRVDGRLFQAEASALYLVRHPGGDALDREWEEAERVATVPFRNPADPAPLNAVLAVTSSGAAAVAWSAWGGTISLRLRKRAGAWTDEEPVPGTSGAANIEALALDDSGYIAVAYDEPGENEIVARSRTPAGSWSSLGFDATGSYGQASPTVPGRLWVAERSGESVLPSLVTRGGVSQGPELFVPDELSERGPLRVLGIAGNDDVASFAFVTGAEALDGPSPGGLTVATFAASGSWSEPVLLESPDSPVSSVALDMNEERGAALWYRSRDGIELYRPSLAGTTLLTGLAGYPGPLAVAPDGSVLGVVTNVDGPNLAVRWFRDL